MLTFHYALLDGTKGQINDLEPNCELGEVIDELEQRHGMAICLVCHDSGGRSVIYGQTGRHGMGALIAPISQSSDSITALHEPNRPLLLLRRVPRISPRRRPRPWCCFFPKTALSVPDEYQERYVMFMIIGLLHLSALGALSANSDSDESGEALVWAIRLRLERILITPSEWYFLGLGGFPFRWTDTTTYRVHYWRTMVYQALNWAVTQQGHPNTTCDWINCAACLPDTIPDLQLFLTGLTRLRLEVFGEAVSAVPDRLRPGGLATLRRFIYLPHLR